MARYQTIPDIFRAHNSKRVRLDKLKEFTPDEIMNVRPCLYYAANDYNSDTPYMTVYAFLIVKQTTHYITLSTGAKLSSKLNGRTYKKCPLEAVHAATIRAKRYLDMQTHRLRKVKYYVEELHDPRDQRALLDAQQAIERNIHKPDYLNSLLED